MATSRGTVTVATDGSWGIWPEPEPEPTVEPEREWWTGKVEQPELPFPPSPDPTEPVVIRSPSPHRVWTTTGTGTDDLVLTWGDSTMTIASSSSSEPR